MAITPPSAITVAITPLPQPPQTSDPANFDVRADAYVLAEQVFSQQVELGRQQINDNAISVAANAATVQDVAQNVLNAPTTMATSTSSQTIGAGTKTFTGLDPSKVLGRGQFVVVSASSAPSNYMLGQVTSPQSGGSVTINVTAIGGSGSFSAWDISLQGVQQVVQRYESRRVVKTAGFTASAADHGVVFELSSASTATMTMDPAATLNAGWVCWWVNTGTGIWTVDPNGSELIDGVTSFSILPGEARLVQSDGSTFKSIVVKPFYHIYTAGGSFPALAPGYAAAQGLLWCSGSGAGTSYAGSGGACVPFLLERSKLSSSQTVTIGGGAVGATGTVPTAGNNSSIGSLVVAYASTDLNYFSTSKGLVYNNGSVATAVQWSDPYAGGHGNATAKSIFGGAAGGSTSVVGGNGGTYTPSANGGAGQVPAGGGSVCDSGYTGGAGARGELRIWGIPG